MAGPSPERKNRSGPRIGIVRMSAIGDVVHILPVVASLRAAMPTAHISWLIQPTPHELIQHHREVDEFILFDRRPLWRSYARLRDAVRGRSFDLVLALHTSLKAGVATALLPAPRKIGFDRARAPELHWLFTTERIEPRPPGHMADEALEFVAHLGIDPVLEWGIEPTPEEEARFASLLPPHAGPTVAVVGASSLPAKDWPPERAAAVIDRLEAECGARALLVGGRSPAEDAAAATIARLSRTPPLDLRAWDLRRLAFLLHRSDLLISPDSGPLHIGVALGTPSIALMGYTNPARVGPVRYRELMVDAYSDPGELPDAARGYRPGRMTRITVEEVVAKARSVLG